MANSCSGFSDLSGVLCFSDDWSGDGGLSTTGSGSFASTSGGGGVSRLGAISSSGINSFC